MKIRQQNNVVYRYLITVLLGWAAIIPLSRALDVGKPAPPLRATTLDGADIRLADLHGDVVIINFWATWCAPCREEMPALEAYYQKYKAKGLRVLAISMDDPADADAVRKVMQAFSFPAALERQADYRGYGRIWRMPMTFVIDRRGILRKDGSVGRPSIDAALLDTLVTPLLLQQSDTAQ